MWILFIPIVVFSVLARGITLNDLFAKTINDEMKYFAEAHLIGRFSEAANIFVGQNPNLAGTFYWSDIKTKPFIPSGMGGANIPSNWKIVTNGSGQYTLCAYPSTASSALFLKDALVSREANVLYRHSSGKLVLTTVPGGINVEANKC